MTGELTPELRDLIEAQIDAAGGGGGGSLPAGGTTGQVLAKLSDADGDADWESLAATASAQGIYDGAATLTISDGDATDFSIEFVSGDALLDLSTPTVPKFLSGGTYAILANVDGPATLTSGGYAQVVAAVATTHLAFGDLRTDSARTTAVAVAKVAAGDPLEVYVSNQDGAATRSFSLEQLLVVKFPEGGGGSQAMKIVTVPLTLADFTYDGAGFIYQTTDPVYTLDTNEHLLFAVARVTEVFNDSGAGQFSLVDATNAVNLGLSGGNVGPGVAPASVGLVDLLGNSMGGNPWGQVTQEPFMPDSAPVPLYVVTSGNGDGATGALTVWLYIGTP